MPLHNFSIRGRDVYRGAILHTICHAMFISNYPDWRHEVAWDGFNYLIKNSQGDQGAISFYPDGVVIAAFFAHESSRSPYAGMNTPEWRSYFIGGHVSILRKAFTDTLQYMLDDLNGERMPVITTAFWADPDGIQSNDSWEEFKVHSAGLIRCESLPEEQALRNYQADYEFSESEMDAIMSLWELKKRSLRAPMIIRAKNTAVTPLKSRIGYAATVELLKQIGIDVT